MVQWMGGEGSVRDHRDEPNKPENWRRKIFPVKFFALTGGKAPPSLPDKHEAHHEVKVKNARSITPTEPVAPTLSRL